VADVSRIWSRSDERSPYQISVGICETLEEENEEEEEEEEDVYINLPTQCR
jgi:hypothetical protein